MRRVPSRGSVLARRVAAARRLWVLLDYDGTLTPIRRRPEAARLGAGRRALIRRLAARPGRRVGIVSGRSLADVRRLVRLTDLVYVGNHGWEIAGCGMRFVHPAAARARRTVRVLCRKLRRALASMPGVVVEGKGVSLSVHYRRAAPGSAGAVRRIVRQVAGPWVRRRAVRLTMGKCVVDVRPHARWHKGDAVRWLVQQDERRLGRALCVYVGDDRTDEDAFRALRRRDISVLVTSRPRPSAARWYVTSILAVDRFLRNVDRWHAHPS